MVSSSSEQVAMKGNSPETARKIAPSPNSNANPKPNPDPAWGGEFSSGAIFRTP